MSEKLRAQVKSRFYYIFWGIATLSVVSGQVYVGSGYREMATGYKDVAEEIRITREGTTEFVEEMMGWMPWVNWNN